MEVYRAREQIVLVCYSPRQTCLWSLGEQGTVVGLLGFIGIMIDGVSSLSGYSFQFSMQSMGVF